MSKRVPFLMLFSGTLCNLLKGNTRELADIISKEVKKVTTISGSKNVARLDHICVAVCR